MMRKVEIRNGDIGATLNALELLMQTNMPPGRAFGVARFANGLRQELRAYEQVHKNLIDQCGGENGVIYSHLDREKGDAAEVRNPEWPRYQAEKAKLDEETVEVDAHRVVVLYQRGRGEGAMYAWEKDMTYKLQAIPGLGVALYRLMATDLLEVTMVE